MDIVWMAVMISVIAVVLSALTFWFTFLRGPRVEIVLGRTTKWVCSHIRPVISGLHLECTFMNPSPKTAVINKMLLEISGPGCSKSLKPKLYLKYDSEFNAVCDGPPHALVVNPRDSRLENIEFGFPDDFMPQIGRYAFTFNIWINRKNQNEPSYKFTVDITGESIPRIMACLVTANMDNKPKYFAVDIE